MTREGLAGRDAQRDVGGTPTPLLFVVVVLLLVAGCRRAQDMATQPRYEPYEPSAFFTDGMSARQPVVGTVPRGSLKEDAFLHTGRMNGQLVDAFPFAITEEVMKRGQQRYQIYCAPCHAQTGKGDGMIVRRGYRRPPSFHTADLRNQKIGHFFDVVTNGFGAMPQYGTMIPVEDRWAIVAYVRALQYSQNAPLADVPENERGKMSAAPAVPVSVPQPSGTTTRPAMPQPASGTMEPTHHVPAVPDPNAPQQPQRNQ